MASSILDTIRKGSTATRTTVRANVDGSRLTLVTACKVQGTATASKVAEAFERDAGIVRSTIRTDVADGVSCTETHGVSSVRAGSVIRELCGLKQLPNVASRGGLDAVETGSNGTTK